MAKKYFDSWEFQHAVSLTDTDPVSANLLLKEYLEKYPTDYYAYSYYAGTFITLGNLEEAEKVLNYIENRFNYDGKFNSKDDKVANYNKTMLYNKLRLLAYKEKYKQLYSLCMKYFNKIKDMDIANILFYSKHKMGRLSLSREETNGYLHRQIMEYSEDEFLDHVKKHLADYNVDLESNERNSNVFAPDFPFNDVLKEIKKYIPSQNGLHFGFIEDTYVFKYDECGKENNRLVNYFKVICIRGTDNIITMCPAAKCEKLSNVDLNYLKKDKEVKKDVKVISQREKFNKRYGINQKKSA